ncbi:MAG: TIGR03936 family radical SAM-associated protein [Clostridiales bacterium]|nr:TIGR03936 family radical SAM-associated protein [Clostridiales bacterium]
MNIIRIKYQKEELVKFVSHLETMKVFIRALRRTRLKCHYSMGFNPQMHLVFGLPLPVGVTSLAEYADIYFDEEYDVKEVIKLLQKEIPPGFNVIDGGYLFNKKNIMSDITLAIYEITVNSSLTCQQIIEQVHELTVIEIEKTRKKKIKIIDIKPMIKQLVANENVMTLTCQAGSFGNLHPRLFLQAISQYIDETIREISIKRIALFTNRDEKLVTPLEKIVLGE